MVIIQDVSNALVCQGDVAWGCISVGISWTMCVELAASRLGEETAQSGK